MKKISFAVVIALFSSFPTFYTSSSLGQSSTKSTASKTYIPQRQIIVRYTPKNISKIPVAFFDADSTLRVALSGKVTPSGADDVMPLPGIGHKIREYVNQGYLIAIVSNQGGIEKGFNTVEGADQALLRTIQFVQEQGGDVHYYDFAEAENEFRKPLPGMGKRLVKRLKEKFGAKAQIDKKPSFMVGDSAYKLGVDKKPDGTPGTHFSNADRLFAKNFKIRFHEAAVFFGWRKNGIDVFHKPEQVKDYEKNHLVQD